MFRGWDPRAFEDYLEASVVESRGAVELRYPRGWEARIFEICPHSLWSQLRRVETPTLVLRGQSSSTLLADAAARMAREMPNGTVTELPGTSHFMPMERPVEVAGIVRAFASTGDPP